MNHHMRQIVPRAFRRVMRVPLLGLALRILASPFTMVYLLLRALVIAVIRAPRAPMATYRRLVRFRDWVLAKAEYLQSESQRWRTIFNIAKSPYSLLRVAGFSPQMAISFLVAGSTIGTGVVVNETLLQEKSFARGDSGVYEWYDGSNDTPSFFSESFNTLRIDLGAVPVSEIAISDVSIGDVYSGSDLPGSATRTIDIGGVDSASTFIEIGEITFERNR